MADQYLFAKPQKRDEEDKIVNPFAGNNMPELGKQNIINPFDSPDSIEEQAPPVNIFEGAEKSAEPSLDERTDSEFYEWFNYNMANPDFAPTDSQYDRFNKIRINKGIKLGKVFDAATEVPAMLWDEMVMRPGKSRFLEMAKRLQKSYGNKLRASAPANEAVMKDFGLYYDDSQRIKNPLDRKRPINLGLSMGPIRPSNDSIQKVRDELKEAWINHNYKTFMAATDGAELIISLEGLSKDEKAEQKETINFLMREKVNSINSIYRKNLKNILPERLHKKIDSMSDKQLKGLFDSSKVELPNKALFIGKELLTLNIRDLPEVAEGGARATADLGVLGTQLRHYLNDKISPDDVEGQRERLKLHRQILMDRMAKHQGESTYIGDTLRAARMDSVADWFDKSIDPATAEMFSYMVGPEAAAGSLVKAPVKAGAKSATAPTRSQMLRDAYTKNIQAPLVKAEKAVGDAITEVLPSAAMKAAGATGGVLGDGAIKVGELPEKIAGKMAFMLTRNADTAADVERIMGKGTYGAGALDIAGGLNLPIPLVGPISVAAGKIKLMGQLGKSLGEGAKAAGRAWNQKSQKQFLARVAFDPKASPALRNFANWASTIDPALGWAANIGNGMGRGALTGGILTLPTKDEAAIGGGLGIGAMLGGGGSFVGLPYASKLRNAEGQAADIKWFGEETEKHGYMTREQYDLLPDKLKLYAADAQMILGDHPEHGFKIILTPDRFTFEKAFKENGGTGIPTDKGVVMPNKRGVGGVAIVNASKMDAVTTLLHEIGGHSVTRGQDMGDLMTVLYDNYGADGIGKMKDEYALKLLAGEKVINNPRISYEDALMSVAKTPSEIDAYIKEKDLSDPSWWAEEVFASHFAKKALEEGGLLGMSKETKMTIATRKALVEKGGAMLQRIGINIRPDGSIPDPTGLFEVSQIKDSPELDLFVRNYLVERANLLHEIRISNKPKARKGAKISPERLKDHPAIKWDWNEKSGQWETDFATKTDDGVVTLKSNSEVKQTLADRLEASNKIISDQVVERSNPYLAPKDDGSGGIEIKGTKLPPEFYDLPQFTKSTKDHARAVEEAIDGDTTFQGWYNAIGTSRNPDGWARSVQKGLGNMRTRFREWKPLGFQTTKAGHILETVLDVDATLAKASQFQSEGRLDQYFNGSLEVFHRDLANYLENHKSGEPGEKGIGPDKRNFIRAFLGVPGGQNPLGMTMPTGESLIKTFRLDRMGEVNPTNRRGFFFDYMKVKQNFMPAGKKKGLPPDVGEVSKGYKGKRTLGKLGRATERNKELQDLAQNVDQMSQAEWNAAVERLDPIIPTPDSKIPNPSMFKAMDRSLKALDKNGKPFVMDVSQYKNIRNPAPGSNVKKVRIDISAMERAMEAYSRDDIETPLHPVAFYDENGIGYASHLYIKDGTFSYPGNIQPRILETSQGRSKDTFIFTEGEVIGGPLPSRAELMRVNNKGERVWTEAGVNPLRHGYAYDKNNPSIKIHGGDRMLLANNSVWVRNARKVEAVKVPGLRRMGSGEFEGPEVRYMPAGKGVEVAPGRVRAEDGAEFNLSKPILAQFMPAKKVQLEDYKDRAIFALAADNLAVGDLEVGPTGAKAPIDVPAQGGRGFQFLDPDNMIWAFTDESAAKRLIKRGLDVSGGKNTVIMGVTSQGSTTHFNSAYGLNGFVRNLEAGVESGTFSSKRMNQYVKDLMGLVAKSESKDFTPQQRKIISGIKGLRGLRRAVESKKINFATAGMIKDKFTNIGKMKNSKLEIIQPELVEAGMDLSSLMRDMSDPELRDAKIGDVVALVELNLTKRPRKTDFHYSYPWTVEGKPIGFLKEFHNVRDLTSSTKIYQGKGKAKLKKNIGPQPLQTVMPVFDKLGTYFMPAGKGGDIFYSNSSKALESPKVRNSATGAAMLNDIIRQDPAARQEMKWIDLDRWLMDKKGKVTKEEVQDFIDTNQIAVVEKVRGGEDPPELRAAEEAVEDARQEMYDADDRGTYQEARDAEMAFEEATANLEFASKDFDPQFADNTDLQLPGAVKGSYRELELMLPKRKGEQFKESHFETDENVFAHVRFNERIDANGKRMLFIEEVQSDWAAKGRDVGFNKPYINGDIVGGREESVPAAPFVSKQKGDQFVKDDKWRALAMKRMIRWASDNNFDRVGWITGRDSADRYNLNTYVSKIEYMRLPGESQTMISAWDKAGSNVMSAKMIPNKDLVGTVGKDLARKIDSDESGMGEFDGLDLAMGGKFHKQFYDVDLPNYTGKYIKKWGGKVGMVDVSLRAAEDVEALKGIPERTTKAHYVDITPQMKADVQQGQAMFMPAGGEVTVYRGTTSGRKVSDRHGGFHFAAMEKPQALEYAFGDPGGVHKKKVNLDKILSEEEARNVMKEIGIAVSDYEFPALVHKQYAAETLLDEFFIGKANLEKFRDELIKRGKLGVRFADFDGTDAGSKRLTKESLFLLNTRN